LTFPAEEVVDRLVLLGEGDEDPLARLNPGPPRWFEIKGFKIAWSSCCGEVGLFACQL
jgi:hypothetical protein